MKLTKGEIFEDVVLAISLGAFLWLYLEGLI